MVFSFFDRSRSGGTDLPTDPVDQVYTLVARDRLIEAIRVLRKESGWNFARAKDVVDRIAAGDAVPEMDSLPPGPTQSPPGTWPIPSEEVDRPRDS